MLTIKGEKDEKAIAFIEQAINSRCSKVLLNIIKDKEVLLVLPNTLVKLQEKHGESTTEYENELTLFYNEFHKYDLVISLDCDLKTQFMFDYNIRDYYHSKMITAINNNLKLPYTEDSVSNIELGDKVLLISYDDYLIHNNALAREKRSNQFIINECFRHIPSDIKEINKPVEIIGSYRQARGKQYISFNVKNVPYAEIYKLINLIKL